MVGDAIVSKLVGLGHAVMIGSREAGNPKAGAWAARVGGGAKAGAFPGAAQFGELVFNCTNGANSIDALRAAGEEALADKTLMDVANVVPPEATGSESLGEKIQKIFPRLKVVKRLNTVNCHVMVDPSRIAESHSMFLCGNDQGSKKMARSLLESFGGKISSIWAKLPVPAQRKATWHSGSPSPRNWGSSTSILRWSGNH